MKCANLHGINDLRYEDIPKPECKDDQVLVQVKNCGICGSDIPRVYSKGTYYFPTVIGHEFSGKVVFDPMNELTGKKVAVFPLLPCFQCDSCIAGNYATCEHYQHLRLNSQLIRFYADTSRLAHDCSNNSFRAYANSSRYSAYRIKAILP